MNDASANPAPRIEGAPTSVNSWQSDYHTFLAMFPTLLDRHRGHYVAIREGKVIASGDDKVAVALEAYSRVGYVPVFVGLVDDSPRRVIRVPSPRLLQGTTSA